MPFTRQCMICLLLRPYITNIPSKIWLYFTDSHLPRPNFILFILIKVIIFTMDDNLAKATKMFAFYSCNEQSLVSRAKLTQILNKQAENHLKKRFNPNIIEEIWGQAETTSKGESTAYTFSKIYSQAMEILQQRIQMIEGPRGVCINQELLISQEAKLKEIQYQYSQGYEQNYDRINTIRKNLVAIQHKIKELHKNRDDFQKELQEMRVCLDVRKQDRVIEQTEYAESVVEEHMIAEVGPSSGLKHIFIGSMVGLFLQMFFSTYHLSFLPFLCYILIVYWLFLGYYDQYFVKTLILGLTLSCFFDLIFSIFTLTSSIGSYWNHSSRRGWKTVGMIFLLLEIGLRIFLMIELYPFREPSAKRQYFELFSKQIQLKVRSGKTFGNAHD